MSLDRTDRLHLPEPLEGPAGSRIFVEQSPDLPLARVTVTLLAGGADDPPGHEGLAWFATELCLRGAGGRSREQLDEALERLGADLAVHAGADAVTFDLEVLSRHLAPAFAILCDCLLRPDLPEAEADKLRREMHAALDELRDENGALARRYFARQLYGAHPYAQPGDGTAESIERLDVAGARRFLERALAGEGLLVSAAGDIDPVEFRELVWRGLGALRRRGAPRVTLPEPRPIESMRLCLVDKPDCTQSQLLLGQPAVPRRHRDFLPLSVATTAFGGTFTARLMTEVRVKRGLSYGASARLGHGRGTRALSMGMAPSVEQTVETLELVLGLWRDFAAAGKAGLRDDEVEFAREHQAQGFAFQLATPEDRVDVRLGVEINELPLDEVTELVPRLRAVEPRAVRAAIRRHLRPDALAITVVSTAADLLPALHRAKLLPKSAIQVVPYDSY